MMSLILVQIPAHIILNIPAHGKSYFSLSERSAFFRVLKRGVLSNTKNEFPGFPAIRPCKKTEWCGYFLPGSNW